MVSQAFLQLKKNEDKRLRLGHPWIFSNEIDIAKTPIKDFVKGQTVTVKTHQGHEIASAYVNPASLISARIYATKPHIALDKTFIATQIKLARQFRDSVFNDPYYRLIFSESDLLPGLIIDRFDKHFAVQINTAGFDSLSDMICEVLREEFPSLTSILLRNDSQIRIYENLERYTKPLFGTPPENVTVIENQIKFITPFLEGQKTGWFYDHRDNREKLKAYVKGKKVLDVFSYVGAWGIQAAAYGATSVDCIDASKFACDYIKQNAALNKVEKIVNVIAEDAFDALKRLHQEKRQYDVIVLDPPAFMKKQKNKAEGLIAYQRINELALKLLADNGILVSCSCSMHLAREDLVKLIQRAAQRQETFVQIIAEGGQGPDHPIHPLIPETKYLKAMYVRKMAR